MPRAGEVFPAIFPLASVKIGTADSGGDGSGSMIGRGCWWVSAMIAATRRRICKHPSVPRITRPLCQ